MPDLPEFDQLVELARRDPRRLEALRYDQVRKLIAAAPARQRARLEGLQFRIDAERRRADSPQRACERLSQMMLASFETLRQALNGELPQPGRQAEIVRLRPE